MNFQPQIIFSHEQLVQWAKETSDNPGTTVYDDAITSANSIRDREERDMIVDTLSRSDAIIKLTGVIIQSKLNMKSVEEQLEIKTSLRPLPAGNHLSEPAQFVFLGRSVCP